MLLLTFAHNNKNLWVFTSNCYIIYKTMIELNTIIVICQNRKKGTNRNQNQLFKPWWGTRKKNWFSIKIMQLVYMDTLKSKSQTLKPGRLLCISSAYVGVNVYKLLFDMTHYKQSTWKNTVVLPTVIALILVGQKKKQVRFPQASHFGCKLKTTSTTFF